MEFIKVRVKPITNDGGNVSGVAGTERNAFIPISKIKAIVDIPGSTKMIYFEPNFFESMNLKFISLSDEHAKTYQLADCV